MKKHLLIVMITFIGYLTVTAQAVYVDSNNGDDKNNGNIDSPVFSVQKAVDLIKCGNNDRFVIKINPGIYVLDHHVSVTTEKEMKNRRIVIEATILPDDSTWTPDKMPVIINSSNKGEIPGEDNSYVISFLVNESHVTIRGIKFHGYVYPDTRYFPIARFNKTKNDLLVEQCMFVGDRDAAHIQVGVIAHGNEINVDHCIFFNARNSVVFWQDADDTIKHGNSLTNSIIYGAFQSAVWTAWPDKDFKFENNIVSNCKNVWIKNSFNTAKYSISNSVIVNNQYSKALAYNDGIKPEDFELNETKIIKEGKICLRLTDDIEKPFAVDYLHIIPGTPGYDIGAGLFRFRKQ